MCLCILLFSIAHGQQSKAIHLQSENNLPYIVLINGSKYTSSNTGNLLISNVPAGQQSLAISFSPDIAEGYNFSVSITDKPRGFTLRQSVGNSWSLFDMIDFSSIDGSVFAPVEKSVVISEALRLAEQLQAEKQADGNELSSKTPETPAIRKETYPSVKENIFKLMGIQKIFDKLSEAGIDQVYIITSAGKTDTIALFIPVLKEDLPTGAGQSAFTNASGYADKPIDLLPATAVLFKPRYQLLK
jgi:hypothetical protein